MSATGGGVPLRGRVRPAGLADVPSMASLINSFAQRGLMLPRAEGELCHRLGEYRVAGDGQGRMLGCGGLLRYSDELAEVVGLAVDPAAHGLGIGASLVAHLVEEALELRVRRIFAMTLRASFFGRLGFAPVPVSRIPEKWLGDCRTCARRVGCREVAMERALQPERQAGQAAVAADLSRGVDPQTVDIMQNSCMIMRSAALVSVPDPTYRVEGTYT